MAAVPFGGSLSALWNHRRVSHMDLVARLRAASDDDAHNVAADLVLSGATPDALLEGVLHATLLDIPPRPVGGPLHAAMVIESVFQLAENRPLRDRWLAALWCLNDYLHYRRRVRQEGEWELDAPPDVDFESAGECTIELTRALEHWDGASADRAVVGLHGYVSVAEVFEVLRPYTARCFAGFGHKLLYAVQLERVLERIDRVVAQPALRSLVACLLHPDSLPETESFTRSVEIVSDLPPDVSSDVSSDWELGREPADHSVTLLRDLHGASSEEAQDVVAAKVREGMGPDTIWNGLRLFASDLFHRRADAARGRHLPVHTVTETNAFDTSRRRTKSATTRRLLVLQNAGWLPLLRAAIEKQSGASHDTNGILSLEHQAGPPQLTDLLRGATQDHHFKYAAAAIEEARRAPDAHRARILAATTTYLPNVDADTTEVYERAARTLRSVGIR